MVRITQGSFSGGIVSSGMYARSDTDKFQTGLRDAFNVFVRAQGGFSNRAGTQGAARYDTSHFGAPQWLIPFAFSEEDSYQLEFSTGVFRVLRNGAYVLDSAVGEKPLTSITVQNPARLTVTGASDFDVGNLLYIDDPNGTSALHEAIVRVTSAGGGIVDFTVYDGTTINTVTGNWGDLGPGATVSKVYERSHTYTLSDMPKVRFAQDADTLYLAHPGYPPRKIGRIDHDDWTYGNVDFTLGPVAPQNLSGTATEGQDVVARYFYLYRVAAISEETFEEGLAGPSITLRNDLHFRGSVNRLTWDAVPGASRYAVYRLSAGSYGFVGTTVATQFADENVTPDTTRGPRIPRNPFATAGNFPSVVAFYEQRLAYGATRNDPQLVEMSRTDNVENFNASYPALPDDAFRFRMRDNKVNRIRAFVPVDAFTILTSGGEWEIAGQGDGEYIRPDRRKLSPLTNYGSADLEPLFTGSVVLYVEPSENVVRDYRPNDSSTQPGDLTVIARDLFEDERIVSWAFASAPHKLVWAVLDNGTLLSMTYMPEHDVWAWTRHQIAGTDARVRQVSVVRENTEDAVYLVVTRLVEGREVTLTERLARREDLDITKSYFMDGGLRAVFDEPVGFVSGLLHLRGETVSVLLDGDVVENLVVDPTGTVYFPGGQTGRNVSVGLPYESYGQTLDVQMEIQGLGSSEGRFKSVAEVAVKLKRSRGVEVGQFRNRMSPLKEWDATLFGQPIPLVTETLLYTVDSDWVRNATLHVRQPHPLPMTILSISPEWEIGA